MHLDLMRDKSKQFPMVEDPLTVTTARIWHCNYASLRPLESLRSLQVLVIATYPDNDFAPFAPLRQLRHLRVLHFPNAYELQPLAELENLDTLSLESLPSWDSSGKVLSVHSLDPLSHLARLRHLELFGVRPTSGGLEPLLRLRALQSARFSRLPASEVSRFYSSAGVSDDFAPDAVFAAA